MYKIEFYSKKRAFRRRLYYWRIRHNNGNIVAIGGEGYYNQADRDAAFQNLKNGLREYKYSITYA